MQALIDLQKQNDFMHNLQTLNQCAVQGMIRHIDYLVLYLGPAVLGNRRKNRDTAKKIWNTYVSLGDFQSRFTPELRVAWHSQWLGLLDSIDLAMLTQNNERWLLVFQQWISMHAHVTCWKTKLKDSDSIIRGGPRIRERLKDQSNYRSWCFLRWALYTYAFYGRPVQTLGAGWTDVNNGSYMHQVCRILLPAASESAFDNFAWVQSVYADLIQCVHCWLLGVVGSIRLSFGGDILFDRYVVYLVFSYMY